MEHSAHGGGKARGLSGEGSVARGGKGGWGWFMLDPDGGSEREGKSGGRASGPWREGEGGGAVGGSCAKQRGFKFTHQDREEEIQLVPSEKKGELVVGGK